ncbi:ABC transporter ATP-binding protein [Ancrocorticia populi]|uniref:ABC transporter ATP-binding protein n=1 Tax=Ancrocorticia populi TaxID=2175228 RepID=UPI003F961F7A
MDLIEVENLTKDYGHGRGVFDVDFGVREGEVFGFLGPNGAGKTTTIRHIMGFSRPQKGTAKVLGKSSWSSYYENQKDIGYLPGEIALPENLTGTEFIHMMADLRGMKDMAYTEGLIDRFELEPRGGLKRMSLGMKRKLAVVTAFMHDPRILVLDEPTSGLDPVMQETFIEFVQEEKARGKTILLSSHIFTEVDATCDRIAIIKDGRLVSTFVADDLRHNENKAFKIEFTDPEGLARFRDAVPQVEANEGAAPGPDAIEGFGISSVKRHYNQAKVVANDAAVNDLIRTLTDYDLKFFSEVPFTLEDYFMKFYDREAEDATN